MTIRYRVSISNNLAIQDVLEGLKQAKQAKQSKAKQSTDVPCTAAPKTIRNTEFPNWATLVRAKKKEKFIFIFISISIQFQ